MQYVSSWNLDLRVVYVLLITERSVKVAVFSNTIPFPVTSNFFFASSFLGCNAVTCVTLVSTFVLCGVGLE